MRNGPSRLRLNRVLAFGSLMFATALPSGLVHSAPDKARGLRLSGITNEVFVTEDGTRSGFVRAEQLEELLKLPESQAAAIDTNGNWGPVAAGFQLSLRFTNAIHQAGAPIVASVILRNVSEQERDYPVVNGLADDFSFSVISPEKKELTDRRATKYPLGVKQVTLPTRTQRKFAILLHDRFNFALPGEYIVTVKTHVMPLGLLERGKGFTELVSGSVKLNIIPTNAVPPKREEQ